MLYNEEYDSCELLPVPTGPWHVGTPRPAWHGGVNPTLGDLTTFHIGGGVDTYIEAATEAELVEALGAADASGRPVFVVGGGSNVLCSSEAFHGVVIRDMRDTVWVSEATGCGGITVRAEAGAAWDGLVALAVEQEWGGFEALSGIPGTVGAAPVQNIGAYGAEIGSVIASVTTWDRQDRTRKTFSASELEFGYRTSILKRTMMGASPRWIVLDVEFQVRPASLSGKIAFDQLAEYLGVAVGERAPMTDVRRAVLDIRRSKGVVLDEADRDTWSAGSFFTNPVLCKDHADAVLPADAPRFPAGVSPDKGPLVKVSAAWLITHAGVARGAGVTNLETPNLDAPATTSTKQVLVLTNRGGATSGDVESLAAAISQRVSERYDGVILTPEPILVGVRPI